MLVTAFCGSMTMAFAEQNDVKLELETKETEDGVDVGVYLTENDGLMDLYLRVEYDTEALELVSRSYGKALASLAPMDNFMAYEDGDYEPPFCVEYADYSSNITDTGMLFSLRFRIKEDAKNGNHSVKLIVRQVGYITGDASDPIYNEKYGDPLVLTDDFSFRTGGVVVAEKIIVTSGGEVDSVRTPELAEEKGGLSELMIGLIVGGVMILVGALVVAYILYRKKNAEKNA